MAAFGYYDGTSTLDGFQFSGTASSYNFSVRSFADKWPVQYFSRGLAFETEKEAKAYENMIRSREISQGLSFFVPRKVERPPICVRIKRTSLSLKQVAYTKRKKLKEKLGLKH